VGAGRTAEDQRIGAGGGAAQESGGVNKSSRLSGGFIFFAQIFLI